jgi:hypothetical protein
MAQPTAVLSLTPAIEAARLTRTCPCCCRRPASQVDGSLILALPTDVEWRGSGGGVTVWEGPEEDEVQWDYAMNPGDICFLDNYVWHQGNPITAGERWALVIFYRTKQVKGTRFSRMFLKAAAERKRKAEAEAAAASKSGAEPGKAAALVGAGVSRQVTVAERAA